MRWDDLHVNEEVWSQDEFDPKAPGAWKRVEEIFSTEAIVCTLRVAEQEIKTTAEHPFWVEGKGWTAVKELQPGDRLRGHDGQLYPVESVTATDEWVPVFNCRIAEYHTYYVQSPGGSAWLWAHNRSCTPIEQLAQSASNARRSLRNAIGAAAGTVAHHIIPWKLRNHPLVRLAAKGGFGINSAANGVVLSPLVHKGGHPHYTKHILEKLDRLLPHTGGDPSKAAELLNQLTAKLKDGLPRLDRVLK